MQCYSHISVVLSPDSFLATQIPPNQQFFKELGSPFQARLAGLEKDCEHFPFQRSLQVSSMFHMIHNDYEVKAKNIQSEPCPRTNHDSSPQPPLTTQLFSWAALTFIPFGEVEIQMIFFGLVFFKVNSDIVENWYNNPFYQRLAN